MKALNFSQTKIVRVGVSSAQNLRKEKRMNKSNLFLLHHHRKLREIQFDETETDMKVFFYTVEMKSKKITWKKSMNREIMIVPMNLLLFSSL